MRHAEKYEGQDIMDLLSLANSNEIIDDELTKGRIRTIFVKVNYGYEDPRKIAEYYSLPIKVIKDIASGKIFRSITCDM